MEGLEERSMSGAGVKPVRILHVEDNETDRKLVSEELRRSGIDCLITGVASREAFFEGISSTTFDLIISDSSLPSFYGHEVFAVARSRCPETPFIVFSGSATTDSRPTDGTNEIAAVIPKDRIADLIAAVKRLLRKPRTSLESVLKAAQWPGAALCLVESLENDKDLGIAAFNEDRVIVSWNEEMERLYGLSAEEALGNHVTDVFTRLGRNGEDLLLYSIIKAVPLSWKESTHVHRLTKTPTAVEACFVPLTDSKNTPSGGIILTRNVSVHKRMVQAGMMVENAFRSAVDGAADAILVVSKDGKIVYGNKKFGRMACSPMEDLARLTISDFLSGEASRTWSETVYHLDRSVHTSLIVRMNRKNGQTFDAEISASLIGGRILLIVRDISDRIAEAADLQQSKTFFQSLAEGARELVFSISADRRVNFVNESFTAMTGWSKWIWLGREISSLVHPDDAPLWMYTLDMLGSGQTAQVFRMRLRCADGSYFRGECSCSPVMQQGRVTGVWHVVRGIDEPFFPDEASTREFQVLSEKFAS